MQRNFTVWMERMITCVCVGGGAGVHRQISRVKLMIYCLCDLWPVCVSGSPLLKSLTLFEFKQNSATPLLTQTRGGRRPQLINYNRLLDFQSSFKMNVMDYWATWPLTPAQQMAVMQHNICLPGIKQQRRRFSNMAEGGQMGVKGPKASAVGEHLTWKHLLVLCFILSPLI